MANYYVYLASGLVDWVEMGVPPVRRAASGTVAVLSLAFSASRRPHFVSHRPKSVHKIINSVG